MAEKMYSVSEAIIFLRDTYGSEYMPKSEETIRRAVRTNEIAADKGLGREGSKISESALIEYAQKRLSKVEKRIPSISRFSKIESSVETGLPKTFPNNYRKYLQGGIKQEDYYVSMIEEKAKWEKRKQELLIQAGRIKQELQRIENELSSCESEISVYDDNIKKMIL